MNRRFIIVALFICVLVAALAAAFASSHPDGLEWVAAKMGFETKTVGIIESPMPDYSLAALGNSFWSTLLSGAAGTVAVFIITILLTKLTRLRSR